MPNWKKVIVSGSDASLTSLNVINGITGSLLGTASWANNATSASRALQANTASYVQVAASSSYAISASQAQNANTASYVLQAVSASYALSASNAQTASFVLGTVASASYALSASYAQTASYADNFTVRNFLNVDSASLDYQQNLAIATGSFQTIVSVATGSYRCAFFDYVTFSGSTVRAGTVVSTWSGSVTEYYENFTADLGGSTSIVILQTSISASNIVLQAGISGSAWSVRSLVRLL